MTRQVWYICVVLIGIANALIRRALEIVSEVGFIDAALQGLGSSFIVWFSLYISLDFLMRGRRVVLSRRDFILTLPALFLFCVPSAMVAWVGFIFLSSLLLLQSDISKTQRIGFSVLLAASLRVPVASIALKLCAPLLLMIDAWVTTFSLGFVSKTAERSGNVIHGPDGHDLLVMTGCTSFTNISLALLLWFTLIRMHTLIWDWRYGVSGALIVIGVFTLNIVRLTLLALGAENFAYYHDGFGAEFFGAGYLIITIIFTLGGIFYVRKTTCAHGVSASYSWS